MEERAEKGSPGISNELCLKVEMFKGKKNHVCDPRSAFAWGLFVELS